MKKLLLTTILAIGCASAFAQKTVYIPVEWRYFNSNDTLLYADNDPENKYTWSKSRSIETDNFIVFWDKYWGNTPPDKLNSSNFYYIDLAYMKERLETFYKDETETLGFGSLPSSNVHKYKIIVCLNHTETWTCYGSGYDYQVPALWLNPSTCKPVGSAVAHEVGHSFHYLCYSDDSKQGTISTCHTGFHDPIGMGAAIWETTANWQALCSYPNEVFSESSTGYFFYNTHNMAFSHEWHRYQAYMFLHYLCEYYNDLQTVYKVWTQPMPKASDFNEALMALKSLTVAELYKLHFDFAMHAATYDIEKCKGYNNAFIGNFRYACSLIADSTYQVAYSSCPQGTGFNVIPLQTKEPGTEITTTFTAMKPISKLTSCDPAEYFNGENFAKTTRTTYNGVNSSYRGFRIGYVVLKNDGTRAYFSADSVYCTGSGEKTVEVSFTVPEGAKQMWLIVAPSLKNYIQHKWDDNITNDDQWPYYFKLHNTDIGAKATVYAMPTIDGRDVANVEFEYDVFFPASTYDYFGTEINISGNAQAALGTAFQMESPANDIPATITTWTSGTVKEGTGKFYPCNPKTGTVVQTGSSANGYGHWFNAAGNVCEYSQGYVYSEFSPSSLMFSIGRYPNKVKNGDTYRVAQAIRYKKNGKIAQATFYFNIYITDSMEGAALKSITEHTVAPVEIIPGDVNLDGYVDISDIVAIINTIAGDQTYKDTADVNNDSNTNISDIVSVINIIAGK